MIHLVTHPIANQMFYSTMRNNLLYSNKGFLLTSLTHSIASQVFCSTVQNRKFSSGLAIQDKLGQKQVGIKKLEDEADLDEKAMSLIFGSKKYLDFSVEEKNIVDSYQERMLLEDYYILPNTKAALEEAEIERLLSK